MSINNKEYQKKYYEAHKNDDSKKCEICGGKYSIFSSANHKKTKKHQNALQEKRELKKDNIKFFMEFINNLRNIEDA